MAVLAFGTFTCEADYLHGPSADLMVNVMAPVFSSWTSTREADHVHDPSADLMVDVMTPGGSVHSVSVVVLHL